MKSEMKNVVVTGVSTGIGHAIAGVLIKSNFHVFGSVRKKEDGVKLSRELGNGFTPLQFDITDEKGVAAAAELVRRELAGQTLLGLVNNAGVAVFGPLMHLPIAEFRSQVEINLTGALIVTQAFLPLLGADEKMAGKQGRIVNISSVGGKVASPFLGPYNASKFGLEGLSDSLRTELMLYGIDVIVIGPGAIATPIWEKAEHADMSRYDQTAFAEPLRKFGDYMFSQGKAGLPPERIGEKVLLALTTAHPKTRYAVVPNSFTGWTIPRLLPKRSLDKIYAKSLGLIHPKN